MIYKHVFEMKPTTITWKKNDPKIMDFTTPTLRPSPHLRLCRLPNRHPPGTSHGRLRPVRRFQICFFLDWTMTRRWLNIRRTYLCVEFFSSPKKKVRFMFLSRKWWLKSYVMKLCSFPCWSELIMSRKKSHLGGSCWVDELEKITYQKNNQH